MYKCMSVCLALAAEHARSHSLAYSMLSCRYTTNLIIIRTCTYTCTLCTCVHETDLLSLNSHLAVTILIDNIYP